MRADVGSPGRAGRGSGGPMKISKTALAALAVAILGVAFAIVSFAGLKGSADSQAGKAQTAISQLQQANKQLASQDKQLAEQLTSDDSQFASQDKQLAGQIATAESEAAKASSVAATQERATDANLGVCMDEQYDNTTNDVSNLTVTAPVTSKGGAVSCQVGSFIPVAPQGAITGGVGGN